MKDPLASTSKKMAQAIETSQRLKAENARLREQLDALRRVVEAARKTSRHLHALLDEHSDAPYFEPEVLLLSELDAARADADAATQGAAANGRKA